MSAFVASLPPFTRRSVLDRTGLAGAFDMELEFVPDQGPALSRSPLASSSASLPELADGPSLVTAIREQLGLRLEPQLGPVEVLVIDHVERPDEN